jgi:site-specific DNA-methyltransferase (adenine-specific)
MEINKIYNESNLETMSRMPDNYIDLVVTSPPYDDMRDYKGYSFPFEETAKELYRITKEGGVVVWIVNDSVKEGSETLTSFRQALYFKDICGFKVHDTMIYEKDFLSKPDKNRYHQSFEYMFVLCKNSVKTFNPIKDKKLKDKWRTPNAIRIKNGEMRKQNNYTDIDRIMYGNRFNIWKYKSAHGFNDLDINFTKNHPAILNIKIVNDHIVSWSNENDLVYDPFMGSGTTAVSCLQLNRNFIGSEISSEYYNTSLNRIKGHNYNYVF